MFPPSYLSEIPLEKRTQAQPSLDSGGGGGDKADSPKKFPSPYDMSNPAENRKAKVSLDSLN